MNRRSILVAALLARVGMTACASPDQPPIQCEHCGTEIIGTFGYSNTVDVVDMGDWTLDAGTGWVAAGSVSIFQRNRWACCTCDPEDSEQVFTPDLDSDIDGYNLITGVSARATTMFGNARASVTGLAYSSDSFSSFRWYHDKQFVSCVQRGEDYQYEFGTGYTTASRNYTFGGGGPHPIVFRFARELDIAVDLYAGSSCDCFGSNTSAQLAYAKVRTSRLSATNLGAHSGPLVQRGVVAGLQDGTVVLLGVFDDAAYAVSTTVSGYTVTGAREIDVSLTSSSPESVVFEETADEFYAFDGDTDGDGVVCWDDRMAMANAQGAGVNDEPYNARCDFNVDGMVDGSDTAQMNARCMTFDFNCDGFFNGSDFDDFTAAFDLGQPVADADMNGFVNGDDFDLFSEAFAAGC